MTASSTRTPACMVLQHTWPSLVAGVSVQSFGLVLVGRAAIGAPGGPPVLLLGAFAAILAFHTMLGYWLGRMLPPVVSVPSALFLSYVWLGFTWSVAYFPLRYLAGLALVSCCRIDQGMPIEAPVAAIAFSVPAALAFFLLAAVQGRDHRTRRRLLVRLTAAVLIAAGASGGLFLARHLGPQPLQPRDLAALTCEGSEPVVCLYPEQEDPGVRDVLKQAYANLSRTGILLAPSITASSRASTPDTYNMAVANNADANELIHSFSTAFFQPALIADCPTGAEQRRDTVNIIVSWLAMHAAQGITGANGIPFGFFQEGRDGAVALDSLDRAAEIEWIEYNRRAVLDCSRDPRPAP